MGDAVAMIGRVRGIEPIARSGVAGLEALTAVRALAGPLVELTLVAPATLVAPEDDFVYRPLAAQEPFAVGRLRRVSIREAARDAHAAFVAATADAVLRGTEGAEPV